MGILIKKSPLKRLRVRIDLRSKNVDKRPKKRSSQAIAPRKTRKGTGNRIEKRNKELSSSAHKKLLKFTDLTIKDIRCGRGCGACKANLDFRKLMSSNLERYNTAPKKEKRRVSKEIVDQVTQQEGRFIARITGTNTWEVLSYKKCVEKCSQTFRYKQQYIFFSLDSFLCFG